MSQPKDPAVMGAEAIKAAAEYLLDAWQRSVLYADIRRQRGDQYLEHLQEEHPNVLSFPCEVVMWGGDLPRPVNYGMVRITPPAGQAPDPAKRPFVVIDPRAGHGPGIGGFKPDSEIGAALQAGHPCYFVGFLPEPVAGQTIEDVVRADAAFVRKVSELHPKSNGKPAVIGNCQAGWQVLMAAALWPDLFGPIIVAGSPLSYWAGTNPMRYVGGLLGGSWLTALTSDLGAGKFDGAWLVNNFENLDPANTLWDKQYNLYSKVDTEGPRYLEFEKYWGGYVFLNDAEIQYIVDKLFIGNKLATAELLTSDGLRIDLRNISSPIVVFCSYGDNITPPPQALGWICDLYQNDTEVVSHDQTIIYATHDSIGHLGIFVSGAVGRKEHREFAAHIDLIDLIPAGIYQISIEDSSDPDEPFRTSIHASSVAEVRAIVKPDMQSERRFQAAERVSEINLALYQNFVQPWVRAWSTPYTANVLEMLQPARTGFKSWSSNNPMAGFVASVANMIRTSRAHLTADNPFLQWQVAISDLISSNLDSYRDMRDHGSAVLFESIYGSPWVQSLAGLAPENGERVRPRPADSPEHREFVRERQAQLHASMGDGGFAAAGVRSLLYILRNRGRTDAECLRLATSMHVPFFAQGMTYAEFKCLIRRQSQLLNLDEASAIAALPGMLSKVSAADKKRLFAELDSLICRSRQASAPEQQATEQLRELLLGKKPEGRNKQ